MKTKVNKSEEKDEYIYITDLLILLWICVWSQCTQHHTSFHVHAYFTWRGMKDHLLIDWCSDDEGEYYTWWRRRFVCSSFSRVRVPRRRLAVPRRGMYWPELSVWRRWGLWRRKWRATRELPRHLAASVSCSLNPAFEFEGRALRMRIDPFSHNWRFHLDFSVCLSVSVSLSLSVSCLFVCVCVCVCVYVCVCYGNENARQWNQSHYEITEALIEMIDSHSYFKQCRKASNSKYILYLVRSKQCAQLFLNFLRSYMLWGFVNRRMPQILCAVYHFFLSIVVFDISEL